MRINNIMGYLLTDDITGVMSCNYPCFSYFILHDQDDRFDLPRSTMQLSTLPLLLLAVTVQAAPVNDNVARADRGHYTVSGLGARKKAILNAGGNTLDLAIAMLETDTMTTNYAYGMLCTRTLFWTHLSLVPSC